MEAAAKEVMEKARRDFLQVKKEKSSDQTTPDIAARIEAKLFGKEE